MLAIIMHCTNLVMDAATEEELEPRQSSLQIIKSNN